MSATKLYFDINFDSSDADEKQRSLSSALRGCLLFRLSEQRSLSTALTQIVQINI
ncbi:MAG: hypothetical protein AB1861_29110 [Cyanobacteriota bacterium]